MASPLDGAAELLMAELLVAELLSDEELEALSDPESAPHAVSPRARVTATGRRAPR